MTGPRREWKSLRAAALVCAAVGGLFGLDALRSPPTGAATTERVVSDPNSGLAISGFDPVAYFTDAAPKPGQADYELRFAGVIWRFHNAGNRAAFAANPDIFMPRFGGYDPISVARGASAPGHPELWSIAEDRLYLFFSTAARDAFERNPASAIDAAERRWPQVLRTLSP